MTGSESEGGGWKRAIFHQQWILLFLAVCFFLIPSIVVDKYVDARNRFILPDDVSLQYPHHDGMYIRVYL